MNDISGSLLRLRELSLSGVYLSFFLIAAATLQGFAQTTSGATTLEAGRIIERAFPDGNEHFFMVGLREGECPTLVVEQRGFDAVVTVTDPEGKPIGDFDAERSINAYENVQFVASVTGTYRIIVKAAYPKLPSGRYVIRLQEVRLADENDRLVDEARQKFNEAWRLRLADNWVDAHGVAKKVLELQERAFGPRHPELVHTLYLLGQISDFRVQHAEAENFYLRGKSIAETSLGPDHYLNARLQFALARHYLNSKGDSTLAEPLMERALQIQERALGPNHPEIAKTLQSLGFLLNVSGGSARAEDLLRRALSICENAYGDEHPDTIQMLNSLASVYSRKGDYAKAEPLLLRSLKYWETTFGRDHGWVAIGLNNLASLYFAQGEFDRAEPLVERALSINERNNGPNHPVVGRNRADLGLIAYSKGAYSKAEGLYLMALPILEKAYGQNHRLVGKHIGELAKVYIALNDHLKAEPLALRALSIFEVAAGEKYHGNSTVLLDLADISAARGNIADAIQFQVRASSIVEYNLNINLAIGSERQRLAYLTVLPGNLDRVVTLHTRYAADDRSARELAAASVLQSKGRVQDAMSHSISSLRDRLSEEDRELLDKLNVITSQLARLVLEGPAGVPPAEHQKRIKGLEEQRERLESEVSRRSAGFYRPSQTVSLTAVQEAIPNDAALIEFALYRPFDPKAPAATAYAEPRYVVYVLNRRGEIGWKDLGPAKGINGAVALLRQAVRDPMRKDVGRLARALDQKVMQPIRLLAGGASRLLISPDGELNLVPFEALVDEKGRNLIENYSITYLTTGRDLVRMRSGRESKSEAAVVADPVFGDQDPEQLFASASSAKEAETSKRRSITNTRNLSDTYFAPLSGTALEAKVIKTIFPKATLVTGSSATETAVKELSAPRVLHIATHGFFLDEGYPGNSRTKPSRSLFGTAKVENPLLRSGLAFAGANIRSGVEDDGILTALEASGLDLWGTKLVVLSACDTGVGEIRNGEGVFGLRRSFALAGAESLVMSLWPVSDQVTRELMTKYYQNLKQGLGRGEALRRVQLEMLKRPARRHPFYWASFIHVGEWADLAGKS